VKPALAEGHAAVGVGPDAGDSAEAGADDRIHVLFEQHVAADPDAPALVCGAESLTYRQLNRRANRLAHYLRKEGIESGSLVGICMHRCVEMIVGVLGVLKAGGAYVPLDPSYPKQRLEAMLNDVELDLLLVKGEQSLDLPESPVRVLGIDRDSAAIEVESAENPGLPPSPADLAYAIFTSGSTGRAKVAAVYQRGWANLLRWFVAEFGIGVEDRVLVVSSFSFDITQRSIAMPLVTGGELHLLDSRAYDPALIREVVAEEEITLINCAPSTFYPLIEAPSEELEMLEPIRTVFLGGEPISASRLRDWALAPDREVEVVNVYGIAECSDVSTFHRLSDYDRYVETSVPAGRPIFNTAVHLLDDDLNPVAAGGRGEICIGGAGVGHGYVNDSSLTEERFVPDPFSDVAGAQLYRTGDMGRALDDGAIELIGRIDHQVKIRGNRIDLGDVETALRLHREVREAVVVSKDFSGGDARLIAYVVPRDILHVEDTGLIQALREFAREHMPEYMLPARIVTLAELPLNPNGKVDRIALAEREIQRPATSPESTPRSPLERQVATTFAEVLEMDHVGVDDNFFDLGGDSYLVTVLLGRLSASTGARLSIFDFVSGPSVAEVVAVIERDGDD